MAAVNDSPVKRAKFTDRYSNEAEKCIRQQQQQQQQQQPQRHWHFGIGELRFAERQATGGPFDRWQQN
jgi:hypothetical protein